MVCMQPYFQLKQIDLYVQQILHLSGVLFCHKSLKLLLLCSCSNRWSDIADGLYVTLFPVKGDRPIVHQILHFSGVLFCHKLLKLLLSCSCNNRWSDIADCLHATLFPVKRDKPKCSPDLTFKWRSVLP